MRLGGYIHMHIDEHYSGTRAHLHGARELWLITLRSGLLIGALTVMLNAETAGLGGARTQHNNNALPTHIQRNKHVLKHFTSSVC